MTESALDDLPQRGMIEVTDRVVIASGPEPRSRALAAVQLLSNGDLLVGYRDASTHPFGVDRIVDDGVVMTVRSTDGGRTWAEPRAVCALPGWDCAGGRSMVQVPDGTLLMFVMKARRSVPGAKVMAVYPIRSHDGGRTWGDFGPELALYPGGWTEANTTAHMMVLSDGRWMMPAYGANSPDGPTFPSVAFSDDGETWRRTTIAESRPDLTFYEPTLIRLNDGRYLAIIRTMEPPHTSYQSYSADEGATWSGPEPVSFSGQTPFLFELESGAVMCVYRDMNPGRFGVSASVTHDDGETWGYAGRIYEGTDWNCGYPCVVRLPDGQLFCVYYTCYERGNSEVHGAFLRVAE